MTSEEQHSDTQIRPSQMPPPPPNWVIQLNTKPSPRPKPPNISDPPGYSAVSSGSSRVSTAQLQKPNSASKQQPRNSSTTEETDTLKLKKSWELALAPAKQLPMNAIMMYMSGNSLQIFSVMMVFMLFKNPAQALLGLNQAFARFETPGTRGRLWAVKAVYVLMQLVALSLGIWKVNDMGLLPTTRSDWLAWETEREPLERVIPAF